MAYLKVNLKCLDEYAFDALHFYSKNVKLLSLNHS